MQPYRDHMPIGDAELVPEDAEAMKKRINQLMDMGADEIKVFKPTPEQLKGLNRKHRREFLKRKRRNPASPE